MTSPALNTQYNYPATGNNGKISSQTDVVSGEQMSYVDDSLNRLASATSSQRWSQTFAFDGFGNLTNVAGVNAPGLGVTYNGGTNQQTTDCADANGNIFGLASCAGSNAYTYDIENRLTAPANAGGMRYSYATGNKRVWRGNGSSTDEVAYWNPSGQKLSAYALSSNSGALVGTQVSADYYFGTRLIKNANGWVYQDRLGSIGKFYPFGLERSGTANGTEKFTGYFRDAETGLDYADQRFHMPGLGRFLTTDPSAGSAQSSDPGTWNRYAYVGGDPVNRDDPAGLCWIAGTWYTDGLPPCPNDTSVTVYACPAGTVLDAYGCDPIISYNWEFVQWMSLYLFAYTSWPLEMEVWNADACFVGLYLIENPLTAAVAALSCLNWLVNEIF
ncbi:MAG: RHS repeat-associated core domain-containing protein [Bryobacterales bacterium]|nr:RHS repeat-associated core domain-containing protein [Bryobacterales bacterium]